MNRFLLWLECWLYGHSYIDPIKCIHCGKVFKEEPK